MVRVAINGFGRIGRQVLQAGISNKKIDFVAINDLTDTRTLAHLLKYDSVYGRFNGDISYDGKNIIVNKKKIPVFAEKDPSKLPWKKLSVDVVVESTGRFTDRDGAELHIKAGAKKVLITAPAKNPDITIVEGVNEHLYDKKKHNIISNGSCTTNCVAQLVNILNKEFSVRKGVMTTVHAYTATQKLVDAPDKDLRRARAAAQNIIPTTTGAAESVIEVIPKLKGKLDGYALRVPVICGSIASLFCEVEKKTNKEQVNSIFKKHSARLKNILEYSEEPLVSADIIKNPNSCIFDSLMTNVVQGSLVTVSGWYDNEWGYSCRIIDVILLLTS